jgi:hypothetical protein
MKLKDYEELVNSAVASDNINWLVKELLERMKINVGLLAENTELKRKLKACEEGRPDWVGPPPYGS